MTIPFGLGARRIVRQAALCCALGTVPPMLSAAFAAQKAPERPAAAKAPAAVQACVQCHGAEGEGQPGSGFPRLAGQGKQYLVKQLQDFRSGRRESPIMQPIAKALDDPAIESVSAYYQSVAAARPALSASARPAAMAGAKLATYGNWDKDVPACFSCHGADGSGVAPHFPAIAQQNAAYTAAQLRAWKSGTRLNDPQGLMKTVADRLSDAEIDAVSVYLESPRRREK